jgi:hypothetical protein
MESALLVVLAFWSAVAENSGIRQKREVICLHASRQCLTRRVRLTGFSVGYEINHASIDLSESFTAIVVGFSLVWIPGGAIVDRRRMMPIALHRDGEMDGGVSWYGEDNGNCRRSK